MKRVITGMGLTLFTLWPLLHRVLVVQYEVNPWKLCGWAMYTSPKVKTFGDIMTGGPNGALIRFQGYEADDRDVRVYRRNKKTLGKLVSQAGVAEKIFERHEDLAYLVFWETRRSLNPVTARIEWRRDITVHKCGGSCGESIRYVVRTPSRRGDADQSDLARIRARIHSYISADLESDACGASGGQGLEMPDRA